MNILNNFELYLSNLSPLAYIVAFISGILVSFTPCIYPLIPVTLGYIGSRSAVSKTKGFLASLSFVLGIASAYSLFGAFSALSGNLFGRLLQGSWAYLLVGVVCLFLGLSLFGLFNLNLSRITLPFKNMKSRVLWNAFFIGFVSAFIISPCTTPVLGTILVFVAMKKNIFFGTTLLFTFALGMGLLLLIVGTFSGILSSMPKSGKWMIRIKKGLALFLLGVSVFYFLKAGGLF